MEYRMRRADGEYRWLLDNGVPRFEPGGGFAGYIGSCVDITDVKRTQEENLAKQKLESVGTLASGIAHDFNNLLGGILAHSELALTDLPNGSRPEEELQRIRAAALRGAEIVQQLMIRSMFRGSWKTCRAAQGLRVETCGAGNRSWQGPPRGASHSRKTPATCDEPHHQRPRRSVIRME
jgi:hypothetical protein